MWPQSLNHLSVHWIVLQQAVDRFNEYWVPLLLRENQSWSLGGDLRGAWYRKGDLYQHVDFPSSRGVVLSVLIGMMPSSDSGVFCQGVKERCGVLSLPGNDFCLSSLGNWRAELTCLIFPVWACVPWPLCDLCMWPTILGHWDFYCVILGGGGGGTLEPQNMVTQKSCFVPMPFPPWNQDAFPIRTLFLCPKRSVRIWGFRSLSWQRASGANPENQSLWDC